MAKISRPFQDTFIEAYLNNHRVFDGESNYYDLPPYVQTFVSPSGAFDRNMIPQLYQMITTHDPDGAAKARFTVGDMRGVDVSKLGPTDAVTWEAARDENDWFAPVAMIGGALAGGALNGAFSGLGGATASAGSIPGMGLSSPWGAGVGEGLSGLAQGGLPAGAGGSVLNSVAPGAGGWGSGVGAAGTAGWDATVGGSGMDFFDLADAWGAGTPNPAIDNLVNLGNSPQLGGGAINFGTGADPYGLGLDAMTPTGSSGWDAVFSGGSNLSAGGPWGDFGASGIPSWAGSAANAAKALLGGSGGGQNGGSGVLNWGNIGNRAMSAIPGLLALNYANNQPGIDTSGLQGILGQFGGLNNNAQNDVLGGLKSLLQQQSANAPGFIQAATDPVQRNIAAGYGQLQQSQALRGIGGSSFGDQSLANYMDQGNRTLANAGATAAQAAGSLQNQNLGLQGTLASGIYNSQLASLLGQGSLQNQLIGQQNAAQKNKNDLFGRAFSAFGNSLGGGGLGGGGGGMVNTNNLLKMLTPYNSIGD